MIAFAAWMTLALIVKKSALCRKHHKKNPGVNVCTQRQWRRPFCSQNRNPELKQTRKWSSTRNLKNSAAAKYATTDLSLLFARSIYRHRPTEIDFSHSDPTSIFSIVFPCLTDQSTISWASHPSISEFCLVQKRRSTDNSGRKLRNVRWGVSNSWKLPCLV